MLEFHFENCFWNCRERMNFHEKIKIEGNCGNCEHDGVLKCVLAMPRRTRDDFEGLVIKI